MPHLLSVASHEADDLRLAISCLNFNSGKRLRHTPSIRNTVFGRDSRQAKG